MSRDRSTGGSAEPTCSNCKPVSGAGVHSENSCQTSAASAVAPKRDSAVNHMVLAEETTEFGASQDHVVQCGLCTTQPIISQNDPFISVQFVWLSPLVVGLSCRSLLLVASCSQSSVVTRR